MEEKVYNKIELDKSIYQDYNKLLKETNYNPFSRDCIILHHPELNTFKTSNGQE